MTVHWIKMRSFRGVALAAAAMATVGTIATSQGEELSAEDQARLDKLNAFLAETHSFLPTVNCPASALL